MSEDRKAARQRIMDDADRIYNSGRAAEAAATAQACLGLFDDDEKGSEEWARFCGLYGSALAESGSLKLARTMFDSAVPALIANRNMDGLATTYFNLGNVCKYANDRQAAFDNYKLALATFQEGQHDRGAAHCLLSLADFFFGIGAPGAAEEYLAQFEGLPPGVRQDPVIRWSYLMQQVKLDLGKHERVAALERLEEALAAAKETGDSAYIAQTQSGLGQVRAQLGDGPGGLALLDQAYGEARREGSPSYIDRGQNFATALERAGNTERALEVYRECLDRIEQLRSQFDFGERFRLMESYSRIARSATRLLFGAGAHDQAFEVSERGQARTTLDLMFRHQIKRQGSRVIRAGFQNRAMLDSPTLEAVGEDLRRSGAHMLKLYRADRNLFAWLLKPNAPLQAWDATAAMEWLTELVGVLVQTNLMPESGRVREPVVEARGGPPERRPAWREVQDHLQKFWRALLPEEVRQYLQTHSGTLVILPHQETYHVPFAAIPCDDGAPLASRWRITVAPSAGVFLQLDPRRDPEPAPPLSRDSQAALAIGGCGDQTVEVPFVPGQSKPTMRFRFRELPATSAEADRVIQLLGGTSLLGRQATVDAVRARMAKYRVLHFATHGYWHPAGDISGLVLGEGVLASREVVELPLKAELVALSACQTGLGAPHPDSYTGLAQSFLIGGARAVLASLWPVADSATLFFMEHFYRSLKEDRSPAESLQRAQQAVRDNPDIADGYNWAAFQLLGRPFESSERGEEFEGPVFCGGDVMLAGMQPGQQLSLDVYRDTVQKPNEALIFRNGTVDRISKQRAPAPTF